MIRFLECKDVMSHLLCNICFRRGRDYFDQLCDETSFRLSYGHRKSETKRIVKELVLATYGPIVLLKTSKISVFATDPSSVFFMFMIVFSSAICECYNTNTKDSNVDLGKFIAIL